MTREQRIELLSRYLDGTCTEEEELIVLNWYNDIEKGNPIPENIDFETPKRAIWERLNAETAVKRMYPRWMVAAAVVGILCIPILFLLKKQPSVLPRDVVAVQDIPAGGNRAVLVLNDGSEIKLDQAKNGQIAQLPGLTVSKTATGTIVYQIKDSEQNTVESYNTIRTPRGGQYQVILPDGTSVFLNAESSLRYPTSFSLSERTVSLLGEAYFDVKKNPKKPFTVVTSGQRVSVLGTHFNVSCYSSEPMRTTLEEGKVEISKTNSTQKATLKPGEQSIVTSEGIEVRQVNLKAAIAWKDGMFIFDGTSMKDVMKQFSRWYNVEVDYSTVPDKAFDGYIPRNLSLLKVLEIINAYSEYKYKLEGRRIMHK